VVKVRQAPEGAILPVKVSAGARRDAILGSHGDALKVSVCQAPEKGKANREVVRLLAGALGMRARDVEILRGQTSRDKLVLLRGADAARVTEKLVTYDRS
jgi:uncharacterized protein (TIGR00251 family)